MDIDLLYTLVALPRNLRSAAIRNIPDTCRHKSQVTDIAEHITTLVADGGNVVLYGEYSTGKSSIAAILLKAALAKHTLGYWVSHLDLPDIIIHRQRRDDDILILDYIREVPVLVLDELVIRDSVGFAEVAAENLIRKRIDNVCSTIITTNFAPASLEKSQRSLFEVLHERCIWVHVAGHNFRRGT